MREILFRGKTKTHRWVEGYLFKDYYGNFKIRVCIYYGGEFYGDDYFIYPETIGQWTGLTDKNGKRIFEGDIVKLYLIDGEEIGVIKYNDKMCRFMFFTKDGSYSFDDTDDFEVIGNIHDNPELLKGR